MAAHLQPTHGSYLDNIPLTLLYLNNPVVKQMAAQRWSVHLQLFSFNNILNNPLKFMPL